MAWPPGNVEVQFENKTSVWAWHITVEREPLVFLFIIILVFAKKLFWFPIPHPFKNPLGSGGWLFRGCSWSGIFLIRFFSPAPPIPFPFN
jgi:hypothetical protein